MAFPLALEGTYDRTVAVRSAIKIFVATAAVVIALSIVGYYIERGMKYTALAENESRFLISATSILDEVFRGVLGDVLILAEKKHLFRNAGAEKNLLAKEFIDVANIKRIYQQIYLVDASGRETVKVDHSGRAAYAVAEPDLQNESHRHYFQQTMSLKPGTIFVSHPASDIKQQKSARPAMPMVRLATPVVNTQGERKGILVLNLLVDKLLDKIAGDEIVGQRDLMLLNDDGYWLYGGNTDNARSPRPVHSRNFSTVNNEAWQQAMILPAGQFRNEQGLFTYRTLTIRPGPESTGPFLQEIEWRLLSYVDAESLSAAINSRRPFFIAGAALSLLLILPVSVLRGRRFAQQVYATSLLTTYSNIIEQSDELIYVVGADGKFRFVNSAFERCTGYKAEEVVGKGPSILKSGRHPEDFYKLLWSTIKSGKTFEGVFVNKKKDGSIYYEAKRIMPFRGAKGEAMYFLSVGHDLSDMYEKRLHEMQVTSQLSKSVPHHFNNLLSIIMGYIQISIHKVGSNGAGAMDEIKVFLQKSMEQAVNAEALIAKIAMSRHDRIDIQARIDVGAIAGIAVAEAKARWPENINIALCADSHLPMISANAELLEKALKELLENAREALVDGGDINIELKVIEPVSDFCVNCGEPIKGKHIQISVRDNGPGISADMMDRIFDPFFSTKESARLVAQTPGLGLTMVRGIVHQNGGHLLLQSKEGRGTKVSLLLPINTQNQ